MPITSSDTDLNDPEVIHHSTREPTAYTPPVRTETRDEKATAIALTSGSSLETVGGAAAVVLAIIALAGGLPLLLTAIATIVLGGALFVYGGAVAARWNDTVNRVNANEEKVEVVSGISSEMLGGAAGVVLGILALIGIMPMVLLPIAAIIFGGSMLLGAPAQPDIARFANERDRRVARMTYQSVEATSGMMALAGAGAAVLGILALLSVGPAAVLTMVAMLGVGGAILLSGGALTARFAHRLEQLA